MEENDSIGVWWWETAERGYKRLNWTGLVASEGSGAAFGCLSFMSLNFFLSFNLCHCLKVSWCFLVHRLWYDGALQGCIYIIMANIWSALVHLFTSPFCKISALIINCIKVPCINPPFDYYNKLNCNKWNVDFYNKTMEKSVKKWNCHFFTPRNNENGCALCD